MELNLNVCRSIAANSGLPLQYVVKEYYVFDVLSHITTETAPAKGFVFKGGTALNKVYLSGRQRFSEDLDYDFETGSVREVEAFCRELAKKIPGYRISEFRRVGQTIQFECEFQPPFGNPDRVRVDVAAKHIVTARPLAIKPASSAWTQQSVAGFHVYSLEDLAARKLIALRMRTEGKDAYDAFNALPLCANLHPAIACMLTSEKINETPRQFIEATISAVQRADPKKFARLTNPFIPSSSRPPDWRELKNTLIARLTELNARA